MKNIEIDEELYNHIARNTQYIGESASSILRRLISLPSDVSNQAPIQPIESESNAVTKSSVEKINTINSASENVFNYINKEELAMQRGAVGRFLLILATLHRVHQRQFNVVLDIRGRDRLYFACSEAELAESGSSTKPRQIPDSPYWVITNSNTTRKKMMLTEAAIALGYHEADAEKIRELL
ncbi:replication initiation negative regulator SeqA [Colwelliaceae bacterium 6471]